MPTFNRARQAALLALLLVIGFAATTSRAQTPAAQETAIFAGGCFWCVEEAFEKVPGVSNVVSGYLGGTVANPTYEQVAAKSTGHAEAVEITYDPKKVSYEQLVDWFWRNIDPFDERGQFCDKGSPYHSGIHYRGEGQKKVAEASKAALEASGRFKQKIVTEIVPAATFYVAEDYHQDYYKKNPNRYQYYKYACGRADRLEQIWGKPTPPKSLTQ